MKTKEAIEFLEHNDEVNFNWRGNFKHIVVLLKRGEKYEQIFNELENCLLPEQYKIVEIIKQKYFPNLICGNCKDYNSDTCFCAEHPEYGELVEQDTCDDWKEDE